jgi:hypothetical protein
MLQCGPWPMGGGGSPEFWQFGGRGRPRGRRRAARGHLGSISMLSRGGGSAGRTLRRQRPAAAAWSPAPARWLLGGTRERDDEH